MQLHFRKHPERDIHPYTVTGLRWQGAKEPLLGGSRVASAGLVRDFRGRCSAARSSRVWAMPVRARAAIKIEKIGRVANGRAVGPRGLPGHTEVGAERPLGPPAIHERVHTYTDASEIYAAEARVPIHTPLADSLTVYYSCRRVFAAGYGERAFLPSAKVTRRRVYSYNATARTAPRLSRDVSIYIHNFVGELYLVPGIWERHFCDTSAISRVIAIDVEMETGILFLVDFY